MKYIVSFIAFIILLIVLLLFSPSKPDKVEVYELNKDLYYQLDGGDGIGNISDTEKYEFTLVKGTRLKVTYKKVKSLNTGVAMDNHVYIISGKYNGREVYSGLIDDWDSAFKLISSEGEIPDEPQ